MTSSFRYGILKAAFKLPFRYKSPSIVDSTDKSPDHNSLQESWNIIRQEFRTIIENTDEELLDLGIYKHPRTGVMNMEQTLDFMITHIRHHQKQMNRITGNEKFPA